MRDEHRTIVADIDIIYKERFTNSISRCTRAATSEAKKKKNKETLAYKRKKKKHSRRTVFITNTP